MADDQCYKVSLMKAAAFFSRAVVVLGALAFGNAVSAKEPFFEGLGSYSRKITTDSPRAQRYFNQGLAFLHGFNHGAAIRSFQEAARLDPKCAMAHWGIALACGSHINLTAMPPPAAELAWKELQSRRVVAPEISSARPQVSTPTRSLLF
jgi:hypothetical protein